MARKTLKRVFWILIILEKFLQDSAESRHSFLQEELQDTAEEFEPIVSEVELLDYVPNRVLEKLNLEIELPIECVHLPNCSCNPDGGRIDCSGKGLDQVPLIGGLPEYVRVVNLSNNKISTLQFDWSVISGLEVLDISGNLLSELQPNSLQNLTKLKELNLSHNYFDNWIDLNPNVLLNPAVNIKIFDLSFNKFKNLSHLNSEDLILSESLEVLKLEGCGISNISGRKSFNAGLPSLKILILKNNPLSTIHDLKSTKLHTLDVSHCQLKYIHSTELLGLPSLTNLIMSHNYRLIISTNIGTLQSESLLYIDLSFCNLPHVSLAGFPNLIKALLSGNMIRLIQTYDFINNTKLEYLDLSSNSISSLNSNTFRGLVSLKFLNLSYNTLSKIPDDALLTTPNLIKLEISRNYIKHVGHIISSSLNALDLSMCEIEGIQTDSLESLTSLIDLNLSKNLIGHIPDGITSSTLKYFDLSFNRLSHVNNHTFDSMPRLIYLDLSSNRFSTIFSKSFFRKNPYLDRIVLTDNTWRCDCFEDSMYEFYEYLVLEANMREDPERLLCHSPSNSSGLTWQAACIYHWFPPTDHFDGDKAITATIVILLCFFACLFLLITVRRLMKARLEAITREREQQIEEARERLRLIRMRHEQEAQCNAPDPRDLISPPSYAEALLLPRLNGSFHSLAEAGEKKKKKRKKSRKSKSSNDILGELNQNDNIAAEMSSDDSPDPDERKESKRCRRRSRRIGSNEIRQLESSPYARRRASQVVTHTVQVQACVENVNQSHNMETPNHINSRVTSGNEASADESDL